jgi:excisionase family DNA binding protein
MTISPATSRCFRARKAAEYLGVSDSTLAKWRMRGDPPAYRKLGRIVVYHQTDLDEWLESCRRQSTSQPEPARSGSDRRPGAGL